MKVSITKASVEHIARLSRLGLKQNEIAKFQKELAAIVTYVDALNVVHTEQVEATSQVTGLENAFAKDEPQVGLSQDDALSQAGAKQRGFFKVKAVL